MLVMDTSVVSYIFKRDGRAAYYLQQAQGRRALISFQTLEELRHGAYFGGWGHRRRQELANHLRGYTVIWPGDGLVNVCAQLRAERKAAGRALQAADAWIAATAIMLNCPLASHDRDFSGIPGLEVIQAPTTSPASRFASRRVTAYDCAENQMVWQARSQRHQRLERVI